jgi:hypothetical protein
MRKFCLVYFFIFIFISCSKKTADDNKTSIKTRPMVLNLENYEPISVCKCSDDGIKTLTKALELRKEFQNLEQYKNDSESLKTMSSLNNNWRLIRDQCLMKFGSKLFKPSSCNNPDKIQDLREKLDALGIRTS